MERGHTLKKVVRFAKREFREKRPLSVIIYRIKSQKVFSKGFRNSVRISKAPLSKFIVAVEHKDHVRIYFFTTKGILFSGQNIGKTDKQLKILQKQGKVHYKIQKE